MGSMTRLGLRMANLRRECNVFFDCIRRTLIASKCTNFDVITQISQQIEYSLIIGTNFDIGHNIVNPIGERINSYANNIYFTLYIQLIFTKSCPNVNFDDDATVPLFQVNKRVFSNMLGKDVRKGNKAELVIRVTMRKI